MWSGTLHEYHLDTALGFTGEIPIWASLSVIVGTLAITTIARLLKSRREAAATTAVGRE